jgi:hypothetical protein
MSLGLERGPLDFYIKNTINNKKCAFQLERTVSVKIQAGGM